MAEVLMIVGGSIFVICVGAAVLLNRATNKLEREIKRGQ